jgi:glutathione S-transferase
MMYTLYGALGSPYSIKIRALLRYRRLPFIWKDGAAAREALARVKAPVIPVLEYPDGHFANDSTPLIYDLEARDPWRGVVPEDPAQAFIAHLIEDFADEWLTKAMFGYRWLEVVDQVQMSRWLAFDALKGGGLEQSQGFAEQFRARQVGRMAIVGCTAENFPLIEASARAVLDALEAHVVNRHCLFGTRPSLAELGLLGQLSQLGTDPTAQAMMRADYPYTYRWLAHIDDMSGVEGEWEAGFAPVVAELVRIAGEVYAPFLAANARALEAGDERFAFTAMGLPYAQGTFKYQAKCLADLRMRYAALDARARAAADPLLGAAWVELLSAS